MDMHTGKVKLDPLVSSHRPVQLLGLTGKGNNNLNFRTVRSLFTTQSSQGINGTDERMENASYN